MKWKLTLLCALTGALILIGCERKSPAEKAADDIGDAAEEVADEIGDAIDKAD